MRYFLDLARENRFRALIFERRFLHEFLSYTYDFFTRKKVRKYILKSKSFLPHQKVFYPLFRSFLEYFVSIFGICEKIIDFGFQKFIFSKFFKLCVYGSYLVFTNSNHLIWTPKPFYATSCHVWESWIFVEKLFGLNQIWDEKSILDVKNRFFQNSSNSQDMVPILFRKV